MKRFWTIFVLLVFVTCCVIYVSAAAEETVATTEATTIDRTFRREPLPPSDEVQSMWDDIKTFSVMVSISGLLILAAVVWMIVECVKNRAINLEIRKMLSFISSDVKMPLPGSLAISLGITCLEVVVMVLGFFVSINRISSQMNPMDAIMLMLTSAAIFTIINLFLSLLGLIFSVLGFKSKEYRVTAVILCIWHGLQIFLPLSIMV